MSWEWYCVDFASTSHKLNKNLFSKIENFLKANKNLELCKKGKKFKKGGETQIKKVYLRPTITIKLWNVVPFLALLMNVFFIFLTVYYCAVGKH